MKHDLTQHKPEKLTLTPLEASRFSGVGLNTLRDALRAGALPAIRVGRNYRIRRETLERWLTDLEEVR